MEVSALNAFVGRGEFIVSKTYESLINQLISEKVECSNMAKRRLIKMGPRVVKMLIQSLNSENVKLRCHVAYILGKIKDPRAFESLLLKAIKDSAQIVRYDAILALGDLGDIRAIEPLIQIMLSEDIILSSAAAMALVKIGSPAIPSLIKLLKDMNPKVRAIAANVLGGIGGSDVVEYLSKSINDKSVKVRIAVAEALAEIAEKGYLHAIEVLKIMLNDPDQDVQDVVKYWLKKLSATSTMGL